MVGRASTIESRANAGAARAATGKAPKAAAFPKATLAAVMRRGKKTQKSEKTFG